MVLEVVSSLPVELTHFIAACENDGQQVLLYWSTKAEINNEGFWVEKSNNGVQWSNIGFVPGAGNRSENVEYTYPDKEWSGYEGTLYYRLLQKDFDGTSSYSDIVSVKKCGGNHSKSISLFPNPVQDILHIQTGAKDQSYTAQIYNTQGQLVSSESITAGTGTIDVSALGHGMYLIHIININHQIIHIQKLVR